MPKITLQLITELEVDTETGKARVLRFFQREIFGKHIEKKQKPQPQESVRLESFVEEAGEM